MAALSTALRTLTRLTNTGINGAVVRQASVGIPALFNRGLRTPSALSSALLNSQPLQQEVVKDNTKADSDFTHEIIEKVDKQVREGLAGRLFAAVYLQGKQHLVTPGDLIVVQSTFYPNIGDVIRLEKVMMVGARDFSLFGRPLLGRDLVKVEATVVEKTLSHCRIYFYYKRRKNNRKTRFNRTMHTMLRINSIEITHGINEVPEVTGVDGRTL